MSLRSAILVMSALGVISDSILIAFYPQFFELRYGSTSPILVGSYIASISIAVMCTLPFWARLALKVETMHLLLWTQLAAGLLGVISAFAPTVASYWAITMVMFMTKASYLLMFPYLMRLEKHEDHGHVIGLLSVIIHIAGIMAATFGGWSLQHFGSTTSILVMAAGDFCQMTICYYLIQSNKVIHTNQSDTPIEKDLPSRDQSNGEAAATLSSPQQATSRRIMALAKLCLIMLVFDFSAYLIRPFFSVYWEDVSGLPDRAITGAVFAIPALAALLGLWGNKLADRGKLPKMNHTLLNLMLGVVGLAMQSTDSIASILIGRFLFGWGLFQIIVKLEVTLFKISSPEYYARDFSVTNFCQNLGVLLSSFGAGYVVSILGIQQTFVIAAIGFVVTAIACKALLNMDQATPPKEPVSDAIS